MTTEQKAKELVDKFTQTIWESGNTVSNPMILKVCIVCVNEILNEQVRPDYLTPEAYNLQKEYWNEVLTHLKH
jgi:hypothetical protein